MLCLSLSRSAGYNKDWNFKLQHGYETDHKIEYQVTGDAPLECVQSRPYNSPAVLYSRILILLARVAKGPMVHPA